MQGLRLVLALVAGIVATPAAAVGIGQAKVESFLGEPLRVRVAISFAPGENITGACVRVASPPGQESPFIPDLAKAKFQLIEGPRGAELMITTRHPYTDPILVFPLKVGCGAGGIYREITLLIDPPGMAAPTRAARAKPAPAPSKPRSAPRPSGAPMTAPVSVEGGEWYVDRGETLTGIIIKSGLDGGDRKRRQELIDEVVVANPNVFRGRGPDYLPAGATLTLPGWGGSKARGEAPVAMTEPTEKAEPAAPAAPEQPATEKEEDFRLKLTGEQPEGVIVTPEMKLLEEELAKLNAASEEERQVNQELQDRLLQLKQQAAELQLVAERMARDSEQLAQQRSEAEPAADGTTATLAATPTEPTLVNVEPPSAVPSPPPPAPEPDPMAPASINNWINANMVPIAAVIFVGLLLVAFLIRGGRSRNEGPTLDELIAQKEIEREAQLREVKETVEVVHEEMLADIEADIADREEEATRQAVGGDGGEELMASADSTHYIFSVEEVDSLLEQSEVLLLFGEPTKAIMMIEEYLDGPGKDSREARPWLKLFQLLRSEERRSEFEERAHTFKRWFNIEKPNWQTYAPGSLEGSGVGLEEACPHIAHRIEEIWNAPGEAFAYLDAMLLDDRDGERVGFPHLIAEDMLMLRDLARERDKAA